MEAKFIVNGYNFYLEGTETNNRTCEKLRARIQNQDIQMVQYSGIGASGLETAVEVTINGTLVRFISGYLCYPWEPLEVALEDVYCDPLFFPKEAEALETFIDSAKALTDTLYFALLQDFIKDKPKYMVSREGHIVCASDPQGPCAIRYVLSENIMYYDATILSPEEMNDIDKVFKLCDIIEVTTDKTPLLI